MVAIFVVVGIAVFIGWQIKRRREQGQLAALRAKREAELALLEAQKQKELVTYVVPNEVIPKRTIITDRMVRVVSVEKAMAPWGDGDRKAYPASVDQVVGRIAMVRLAVQEPIRKERLAAKDDLRAVSFIIEQGKRAVTIPINLVRGVGGFIRQGDFVDVLGSFTVPGGQNITKNILRKVRILIVDKTYLKEKGEKSEEELEEEPTEAAAEPQPGVPQSSTQAYNNLGMVTFEVTPAEAEKLVLASAKIPLTLVLRNPNDPKESGEENSVTLDQDIFVDDSQLTVDTDPVGEVEVILGDQKQVREVGVQ